MGVEKFNSIVEKALSGAYDAGFEAGKKESEAENEKLEENLSEVRRVKSIYDSLINLCAGCGKKIEGGNRWTTRKDGMLRFAHQECIKAGLCKWIPYN